MDHDCKHQMWHQYRAADDSRHDAEVAFAATTELNTLGPALRYTNFRSQGFHEIEHGGGPHSLDSSIERNTQCAKTCNRSVKARAAMRFGADATKVLAQPPHEHTPLAS